MSGTKRKAKKDPNAPKAPRTAYVLWSNSKRGDLQAANPDEGMGGISKLLGAEWKTVDSDEKAEWKAKSDEDKQRYAAEMEDYEPGEGYEAVPTKKAKKTKDPNAPKRAMTAYFLFLADVREETKEENPGCSVTELSKAVGFKWKALTDDEKAPYSQKAEQDKKRYAIAKAAYDAKLAAAAAEQEDEEEDGDEEEDSE